MNSFHSNKPLYSLYLVYFPRRENLAVDKSNYSHIEILWPNNKKTQTLLTKTYTDQAYCFARFKFEFNNEYSESALTKQEKYHTARNAQSVGSLSAENPYR